MKNASLIKNMGQLVGMFLLMAFLFQPSPSTDGQVPKTPAKAPVIPPEAAVKEMQNRELKKGVDIKQSEAIGDLKEAVANIDEAERKPKVLYKTKWRTQYVHDTIIFYQCPPDSVGYDYYEGPDTVYMPPVHDTIYLERPAKKHRRGLFNFKRKG